MSEQPKLRQRIGWLVIELRWLRRIRWIVPQKWITRREANLHALSYLYYSLYGAPSRAGD